MAWCTTCGSEGFGTACPRCGAPYPAEPHGQWGPQTPPTADTILAGHQPSGYSPASSYPSPPPQPPGYPQQQWAGPQAGFPATPPRMTPTPPARRRSAWPFVLVGAAVLAVAGVAAALLVPRFLQPQPQAAKAPVTIAATTVSPRTTAPVAPPSLSSPTPVIPAPTVTVTTTVVQPAAGGGADVIPGRAHVTVLDSLPQNQKTLADARAEADRLTRASGRIIRVLDSSTTTGMNPGYWALVDGPHPTEDVAKSVCGAYGRSVGGTCYPRLIG